MKPNPLSFFKQKSKALIHSILDKSLLNLVSTFSAYAPYSSGGYSDLTRLTVKAITQFPVALNSLYSSISADANLYECSVNEFLELYSSSREENHLAQCLNNYGSDKALRHSYHIIYSRILASIATVSGNLFEIGLGTNDPSLVSSMGKNGRPGASLFAFKHYLPSWNVFGGDIDKQILFDEDEVRTIYLNQLEPSTISDALSHFSQSYNIIIDDGLHSPLANINVISVALSRIEEGGWIVIEDISPDAREIWKLVSRIIANGHSCYLIDDTQSTTHSLVFAIQKT